MVTCEEKEARRVPTLTLLS
ncbi:hypothetical protein YPPY29_2661, partial [Yersinia pestis PY-29]